MAALRSRAGGAMVLGGRTPDLVGEQRLPNLLQAGRRVGERLEHRRSLVVVQSDHDHVSLDPALELVCEVAIPDERRKLEHEITPDGGTGEEHLLDDMP